MYNIGKGPAQGKPSHMRRMRGVNQIVHRSQIEALITLPKSFLNWNFARRKDLQLMHRMPTRNSTHRQLCLTSHLPQTRSHPRESSALAQCSRGPPQGTAACSRARTMRGSWAQGQHVQPGWRRRTGWCRQGPACKGARIFRLICA